MKDKITGSGSSFGNLHFGNGSSLSAEIVSPSFPLLDLRKSVGVSDFYIQAPNVKIDFSLQKIIEKESERLSRKRLKYTSKELEDWQLASILKTGDYKKNSAKVKLMRDGKSAVVSEVSKSINASSIDHTSKYLLSNEPLYVYALSYAIYYEKVKDAEGLNDRVVKIAEHRIKTYFNKVLAIEVIKDKHLELTSAQKNKILQEAANTRISYLKGEPLKAINRIISKYVNYGKLHTLVDRFFTTGEIDPEKGTPQIRQLMVNYLIDIGLVLSDDDLEEGYDGGVDIAEDFLEGSIEDTDQNSDDASIT